SGSTAASVCLPSSRSADQTPRPASATCAHQPRSDMSTDLAGPGVVIVGGGQAGVDAAFALRLAGYGGAVTIVSDEVEVPYRRPPLSKEFLDRADDPEVARLRAVDAYDDRAIALRLGSRVAAIDRSDQLVRLQDGAVLAYD